MCNPFPVRCVLVTGRRVPGVNWGRRPFNHERGPLELEPVRHGRRDLAVLASATIWLLITDPVTVADAVETGQVSPLVQALAGVLYDAFKGILRYL